jgi:hypothetical protein
VLKRIILVVNPRGFSMDSYFCPQLTSVSDYESIQKMLTSWKKSGKEELVFWTSNQAKQTEPPKNVSYVDPEKKWYRLPKFAFWMYLSETSEAKDGTNAGLRFRVRVIQASHKLNEELAEHGSSPGIYLHTYVHDEDNSADAKMWFKCDLVEEFRGGRGTNLGFKAVGEVKNGFIYQVQLDQVMPSLVVVQTTGNYPIL